MAGAQHTGTSTRKSWLVSICMPMAESSFKGATPILVKSSSPCRQPALFRQPRVSQALLSEPCRHSFHLIDPATHIGTQKYSAPIACFLNTRNTAMYSILHFFTIIALSLHPDLTHRSQTSAAFPQNIDKQPSIIKIFKCKSMDQMHASNTLTRRL